MSRRHSPHWRDRLPFRRPERDFTWRGQAVSRLEGLSDVVFGFALTLLVVATEVPRTFDGLLRVLRDFPAFAACFALLMLFWNEHYRFFRRYGLEDFFTRVVNYFILLLVLFSVYPLKFLFSSWLGSATGGFRGIEDVFFVYQIYGFGFASIWALYALLMWHVLRLRDVLRLTPVEVVLSRLELNGFLIQISVCFMSITLSYLTSNSWLPGVVYAILGPLMGLNGWWHGRQVNALRQREERPIAA